MWFVMSHRAASDSQLATRRGQRLAGSAALRAALPVGRCRPGRHSAGPRPAGRRSGASGKLPGAPRLPADRRRSRVGIYERRSLLRELRPGYHSELLHIFEDWISASKFDCQHVDCSEQLWMTAAS